ncbi:NADH dehydrogenase [ubiquinone] 1 alpha subcomplex assembly factor 8 [Haemaphysalis longicornis]
MNAVKKARQRLSSYPDAYIKCSKQAVAYGTCVARVDDLKMHHCAKEFGQLKSCIQKHVKKP